MISEGQFMHLLSQLGVSVVLTPMETEGSWDAYLRSPHDFDGALPQDHPLFALTASSINPNNALRRLRVLACKTLEGME